MDNPTTERGGTDGAVLKFGEWVAPAILCPTCRMNWSLNKPARCGAENSFRCIGCKAIYTGAMLAASELFDAALHCIIPLEWARDHIDPMFSKKVQANINAINAAIAKATGAES